MVLIETGLLHVLSFASPFTFTPMLPLCEQNTRCTKSHLLVDARFFLLGIAREDLIKREEE